MHLIAEAGASATVVQRASQPVDRSICRMLLGERRRRAWAKLDDGTHLPSEKARQRIDPPLPHRPPTPGPLPRPRVPRHSFDDARNHARPRPSCLGRSPKRLSPPRRRERVRDQSCGEGTRPWRACHSRIACSTARAATVAGSRRDGRPCSMRRRRRPCRRAAGCRRAAPAEPDVPRLDRSRLLPGGVLGA